MAELEKVIKQISAEIKLAEYVNKDYQTIDLQLLKDVLELLKEQEEVEPKKTAYQRVDHKLAFRYRCGLCDQSIFNSFKFCPFCGRKVKWE